MRINYTRIWPRATVRQISVVFDMFRLLQPRTHLGFVVCEDRQLCSEKKCDTGQRKGIVCTRELKMTPSNDVLVSDALLEDKFVTIWPDYPCLYDVRSVDFRNKICYRRPWKLYGSNWIRHLFRKYHAGSNILSTSIIRSPRNRWNCAN